jgi:hypothetical protein
MSQKSTKSELGFLKVKAIETNVTNFLAKHDFKTLYNEPLRKVKGGGINTTIVHKDLTTDKFTTLIKRHFPNAKFRYGHWNEWCNLTFYL